MKKLLQLFFLFALSLNCTVIFAAPATTTEELLQKYNSPKKVKILLVPGHEINSGGTEYYGLLERELVVRVADELRKLLADDRKFEVLQLRDTKQFNSRFERYFQKNKNQIARWVRDTKSKFSRLLKSEKATMPEASVAHNTVIGDSATRLYSINRWAGENDIDIILHIHFNDYAGRNEAEGEEKYSGFAIYIPDTIYQNSQRSSEVAEFIFSRLSDEYQPSNFPGEDSGIVLSPDLIAIGPFDTSKSASILIEYSYIFEPHLQDYFSQEISFKQMALQTYLGLTDFFQQTTQ